MALVIPSGLGPAQLQDWVSSYFLEPISAARASKCALLATIVLGCYDHLLTADRELRHIWRTESWTLSHLIFLFTRYSFPLLIIGHVADNFGPPRYDELCRKWIFISTYWTYLLLALMHWLVALRVYAYWGRSRRVIVGFAVLWAVSFGGTLLHASLWLLRYVKGNAVYDPILNTCYAEIPPWMAGINLDFLILEVPAFALTVYRYHSNAKLFNSTSLLGGTLFKNGIIYLISVFLLTFGAAVSTRIASFTTPSASIATGTGVPRYLTLAILVPTVSRLVLSLPEAIEKTTQEFEVVERYHHHQPSEQPPQELQQFPSSSFGVATYKVYVTKHPNEAKRYPLRTFREGNGSGSVASASASARPSVDIAVDGFVRETRRTTSEDNRGPPRLELTNARSSPILPMDI